MSPLSRLDATAWTPLLPNGASYSSLMFYSLETSYHHESEENALDVISVYNKSERSRCCLPQRQRNICPQNPDRAFGQ